MPWINELKASYPYDVDNISKLLIGCKVVSFTKATGRIRDVMVIRGDEFLVIIEWDHRLNDSYVNYHGEPQIPILIPEDRIYLLDKIRKK